MRLKQLDYDLTVCKVATVADICLDDDFLFLGKTDEEISLVCKTQNVPKNTVEREDGWKGFYVGEILDFSLMGILSDLSATLARCGIAIFAVSTYNTDYILVRDHDYDRAIAALTDAGHSIV